MLLGCTASRGEESRLAAGAGFGSAGLNSVGSHCFPVAEPSSRMGVSCRHSRPFVPS